MAMDEIWNHINPMWAGWVVALLVLHWWQNRGRK
jgi:hypothetical protein